MKRLTLLRHAKSSWDDHGLPDHDRPLAVRGLRDAPTMGKRLAAQGIAPDLLLTSTALRARMTADLVAASLGLAPPIRTEARIYLASPGELLAIIAAQSEAVSELLLVGHNPGLTQLANMLLPDLKLANLPTAGAVSVEYDGEAWSDLDAGGFRLRCYDYPKNPQAIT